MMTFVRLLAGNSYTKAFFAMLLFTITRDRH
jgi:hypothetical protein